MKLIQLSEHSEPKPYILKTNYPLETKATYFNSKEDLIKSPQTQFLSYCVANGYENIYDLEKDTIIKNFINALTDDEYEDLHKDIVEYNYGKTYGLPKSIEITHDNEIFDLQVDAEDIKTLLFEETNNLYEFDQLDDFCDYLVDNVYNDYDILGVIKYTVGTDTKTHTFTNKGDIYFSDVYKAIKQVLKNETVTHITSLSVDEETDSCTITNPSKTILLTFSWAPYK